MTTKIINWDDLEPIEVAEDEDALLLLPTNENEDLLQSFEEAQTTEVRHGDATAQLIQIPLQAGPERTVKWPAPLDVTVQVTPEDASETTLSYAPEASGEEMDVTIPVACLRRHPMLEW